MAENKTLSKSNLNIFDLPFIGTFTNGNPNGFSFIDNSIGDDLFAHISANIGNQIDTMESLDFKKCAFIIGGDPFAYKHRKQRWKDVVIGWKLLSEIKSKDGSEISIEDIISMRKESFKSMDLEQFNNFLNAEWYHKKWSNIANANPKTSLKRDVVIEDTLIEKISMCANINEIEKLFYATDNSFWFPENRKELMSKYFSPKHWNNSCFKSFDKSIVSSPFYKEFKNEIDEKIISMKSVSIDLESNGRKIFQYGWYSNDDNGLIKENKGINNDQIIDAVNTSIISKDKSIIIGHNFLLWDKPILEKHKIIFNERVDYWDTLIISLLLQPWKSTHALINDYLAHQADSDAEACYKLFNKQFSQLNSIFFLDENNNSDNQTYDTKGLIDVIFENPEILSEIINDFPNELDGEIKSLDKCNLLLIPENLIKNIGWNKNLYINIDDAAKRVSNPILDSNICKKIAENFNDLHSKLVFIIVYHASKNDVKVLLTMLPKWLISEELKSSLIQEHADLKTTPIVSASTLCYINSDLMRLDKKQQKGSVKFFL